MKEVLSSKQFEEVCRNFNLDRQMQKGVKENIFNEENLIANNGKIAKMFLWNSDQKNFNPHNLLGTWKYIYTLDENGYTINISYGELTNLVEKLNAKIYDIDKNIIFDDVKLETLVDGQKVLFGKAFTFDLKNKKFNIRINGTLFERIKQLKFIEEIFDNGMFLINDVEFKILPNKKEEIKFKQLLNKYTKIKDFLLKHNILKDVCLDNWEDKDFNKLEFWMNAIENNKPVELGSNISLVGSISIKDIRLSIFAKINSDKKFDIASLWNNDIVNKYHFKYQSNQEEIETNNFYLVLNSESYQSDDINAEEMKNSFGAKKLDTETLKAFKQYPISIYMN